MNNLKEDSEIAKELRSVVAIVNSLSDVLTSRGYTVYFREKPVNFDFVYVAPSYIRSKIHEVTIDKTVSESFKL